MLRGSDLYQIKKDTSIFLKGIAILLMLIHHMFTFPNWIVFGGGGGYSANILFAQLFKAPTRICVGIFAFITGWAFSLKPEKTFKWIKTKILSFYVLYWLALIFILLFALLICDYHPSALDVLMEIIGFSHELMKFCWYVPFYVTALILLYCIYKQMDKTFVFACVWGFAVPIVLFTIIQKIVPIEQFAELANDLRHYFPCIAAGYVCNRYNIFGIVDVYTKKINPLIILTCTCVFAFVGRHFFSAGDFIYSPIIIFGIVNTVQQDKRFFCGKLEQLVIVIGKQSTNMWFLHCIIFNSITNIYIQPYIYWSANPLVVFTYTTFVLYCFSSVLFLIDKRILKYIEQSL